MGKCHIVPNVVVSSIIIVFLVKTQAYSPPLQWWRWPAPQLVRMLCILCLQLNVVEAHSLPLVHWALLQKIWFMLTKQHCFHCYLIRQVTGLKHEICSSLAYKISELAWMIEMKRIGNSNTKQAFRGIFIRSWVCKPFHYAVNWNSMHYTLYHHC